MMTRANHTAHTLRSAKNIIITTNSIIVKAEIKVMLAEFIAVTWLLSKNTQTGSRDELGVIKIPFNFSALLHPGFLTKILHQQQINRRSNIRITFSMKNSGEKITAKRNEKLKIETKIQIIPAAKKST